MVNLLFFQQLVLMSMLLCPISAFLCFLMLIFNFKFDVLKLKFLQAKPLKPWAAEDAGRFFVKFFTITLVIYLATLSILLFGDGFTRFTETPVAGLTSSDDSFGEYFGKYCNSGMDSHPLTECCDITFVPGEGIVRCRLVFFYQRHLIQCDGL